MLLTHAFTMLFCGTLEHCQTTHHLLILVAAINSEYDLSMHDIICMHAFDLEPSHVPHFGKALRNKWDNSDTTLVSG